MIAPWMVLLACGNLISPPATDTDAVFPHGEAYDTWSTHGADARRIGVEACATCHGDGRPGKPCAECHDGWPHPDGWSAGTRHGEGLAGNADRSMCAKCHEAAGSVAQTTASCAACHPSWPHAADWLASHGGYALSRGTNACVGCHGADLDGTAVSPPCTACHATWPHPADWLTSHPDAARDDLSVCTGCHGAAGSGGPVGVACARCHATYPHPADWSKTHLDSGALGESHCLQCHEAGDGPPLVAARCADACHGGAR